MLIVSSARYLEVVTTLTICLPVTSVDRGWPNHVMVEGPSGLATPSWILTEQPRILSRDRLTGVAGQVSDVCFAAARRWLDDFLATPASSNL